MCVHTDREMVVMARIARMMAFNNHRISMALNIPMRCCEGHCIRKLPVSRQSDVHLKLEQFRIWLLIHLACSWPNGADLLVMCKLLRKIWHRLIMMRQSIKICTPSD